MLVVDYSVLACAFLPLTDSLEAKVVENLAFT